MPAWESANAAAFDPEMTDEVLTSPDLAWLGEPLPPATPDRLGQFHTIADRLCEKADTLDLDKSWRSLQMMTEPKGLALPGPAHLMFAGEPTWCGHGHISHVRVVTPGMVPWIAADLERLKVSCFRHAAALRLGCDEAEYVVPYFDEAVEFAARQAKAGRGFMFMIG